MFKITKFIKYMLPYFIVRFVQKTSKKPRKRNIKYEKEILLLLKKNETIRNKYLGERCFIIGNGTSLNKMDLKMLKGEYIYTVNNFILHKDLLYIEPTFYSDIEPYNIVSNYLENSPFNIHTYYKKIDDTFRPLKTSFFFRDEFKYFIESNNLFKGKQIHYLRGDGSSLLDGKLLDDISRPNSFLLGVVYSAICNCTYMGFKNIYFIGCDCDWFRQRAEAHFCQTGDVSHSDISNEKLLYMNYETLRNWRIVTTHFKQKRINIFNAGIGGDNDTCERVDYCELLRKKR